MQDREYQPELLQAPLCESPFFEELVAAASLSEERVEQARRFREDGYLVLDLGLDGSDGSDSIEERAARMRRDLAADYVDPGNPRVTDGWRQHPDVRDLAVLPQVLDVLGDLYGRPAVPFQTLNFKVGTQQKAHSDVIHFNSFPSRFMCGVWIALEDTDAANGPLFYYPGSHRLPDYQLTEIGLPSHPDAYPFYEQFIERLVVAHGLECEELHVPAGHALIWSANLIHGGRPILDAARSRHSQVTHYFFEGGAYYIPLLSDFPARICMREVIDLRTLQFAPQYHGGHRIDLAKAEPIWRFQRPLPSGTLEHPRGDGEP